MRTEMALDQMPMTQPQQQVFLLLPADRDYMTVAHPSTGNGQANYAMAIWPQPLSVVTGAQTPTLPEKPALSQCPPLPESQNIPDPVTPRTEVPDESDEPERPRVTASTARRLRRKRAAERVKIAQTRELSVPRIEDFRAQLKRDPATTIAKLKNHVWAWAQNEVGCRIVQEVFELGTRDAAELATELRGHVLEAVMCPYANYVIQKVVSHLSTASSAFVAQELAGNAVRVAKHRFACRIFCSSVIERETFGLTLF